MHAVRHDREPVASRFAPHVPRRDAHCIGGSGLPLQCRQPRAGLCHRLLLVAELPYHPLVGLLGLGTPQLLVALAHLHKCLRRERPICREFRRNALVQFDCSSEVSIRALLHERLLKQVVAALGERGHRCEQGE